MRGVCGAYVRGLLLMNDITETGKVCMVGLLCTGFHIILAEFLKKTKTP